MRLLEFEKLMMIKKGGGPQDAHTPNNKEQVEDTDKHLSMCAWV
jgi:hypothetical protein